MARGDIFKYRKGSWYIDMGEDAYRIYKSEKGFKKLRPDGDDLLALPEDRETARALGFQFYAVYRLESRLDTHSATSWVSYRMDDKIEVWLREGDHKRLNGLDKVEHAEMIKRITWEHIRSKRPDEAIEAQRQRDEEYERRWEQRRLHLGRRQDAPKP